MMPEPSVAERAKPVVLSGREGWRKLSQACSHLALTCILDGSGYVSSNLVLECVYMCVSSDHLRSGLTSLLFM